MISNEICRKIDLLDNEEYCCFFQNGSKEIWSWIKVGSLRKSSAQGTTAKKSLASPRKFEDQQS